ncbi:MAG TPA: winged helix-turn-helix domain-containing protein [Pyrinomonadaceae bacterium]|nr:winged helix-turn-helix domain-containing protein [Pyrinomonadaceae bacterium]
MNEAPANQRIIYQFGRFLLDPQEKTLLVDGQPLHLPAKEFATLLLLVENNGRALSKEQMLQTLWPGTHVEENNLAKYVSRLRKLLNSGEITIETLPKHGYRFSAEVSQILRPAEDTILEKRTVKRLTVKVENDFYERPPLALPPQRKSFSRAAGFVTLGLILLLGAGVAWFWPRQKQTGVTDKSGIVFLTDGSQDDTGARWTNLGQIYFSRYVTSTRVETWQMNADGTGQRRANGEIKDLLHGVWSFDGSKVFFVKENDKTIYLADASGANEIALPIRGGNMDWSPDGSQIVHQAKISHDKSEIFLYTLATGKNIKLTDDTTVADPSVSYDGKQIAFTSWRDGNGEIYVVNADGSNVRRLTNHPAFDNYPVFAPDGTAIAFQSNRENERTEIYLKNLNDDSPPRKISNLNGTTGIAPKCWSADGTEIVLWTNQNGKAQIVRAKVEPYPSKLVLSDETAGLSSPRLAPDSRQVLYEARVEDRSLELRLTDLETNKTRTIFKTAPNYPLDSQLAPAFSPDGGRIVFTDRAGGNSEIFIINADGSNLQNLTNDPLSDSNPVFLPDGNEIIFVRDFYGKSHLYRMNVDGGNQRRVTEKEGYEMAPAFSPDGFYLAFAGDRQNADSRGLDIFLLEFNNPANEKRLSARRFHDTSAAFSPDGKRIAFVGGADGNAEIYLMNSDGAGLLRLTRSKAEETTPQFSKDGKTLIFASNQTGRFVLYQVQL